MADVRVETERFRSDPPRRFLDVSPPISPRIANWPRVLFRTDSFPDPERWNEDFASLSPELVEMFASAGVLLIGIDTPSVDPFSDRRLEAHRELAARGLAHLEGLVLASVEPGFYTL